MQSITEKTGDSRNKHGGSNTVVSATNKEDPKRAVSSTSTVKLESVKSVHSELDIKDEGPIYESVSNYEQNNYGPANPQQNYYYVMQQNPGIAAGGNVMPSLGAPIMQQSVIVQGIASPQVQSYYVQPGAQTSYVMQNPQANFLPAAQQQPIFQQQGPQMIATQPYVNSVSYVPYMVATSTQPQEYTIASMTNQQNPLKPQNRYNQNNRYTSTTSRQNSQPPNGTAIRGNNTTIRDISQRAISSKSTRGNVPQQRTSKIAPRRKTSQTSNIENSGQKTTSLIVLSDSDDEIEMIITEKTNTEKEIRSVQAQRNVSQSKQKPVITSDITVASAKGVIPPQIIQRMNQGGISITPIKNTPPPPTTNGNTQIVVVVNETGSHYALALPNGSKLILTPEQVAQIRASNGGKLIL